MGDKELSCEDSLTSWRGEQPFPRWVKVSTIAAASALVGGMAAAWYYRKTLRDLREAEESAGVPDFGISEEHVDMDT